jgi:hypothetical protein
MESSPKKLISHSSSSRIHWVVNTFLQFFKTLEFIEILFSIKTSAKKTKQCQYYDGSLFKKPHQRWLIGLKSLYLK